MQPAPRRRWRANRGSAETTCTYDEYCKAPSIKCTIATLRAVSTVLAPARPTKPETRPGVRPPAPMVAVAIPPGYGTELAQPFLSVAAQVGAINQFRQEPVRRQVRPPDHLRGFPCGVSFTSAATGDRVTEGTPDGSCNLLEEMRRPSRPGAAAALMSSSCALAAAAPCVVAQNCRPVWASTNLPTDSQSSTATSSAHARTTESAGNGFASRP